MSRPHAPIEEIDLTLSSPEPEAPPLPQARPPAALHRRPTAPTHHKSATERSRLSRTEKDSTQPQRTPTVPRSDLPIHPAHVEQIVKTTDPKVLQDVILSLCAWSPALSAAVVRGLRDHSSYAKHIVKKHRIKAERVAIPEPSQHRSQGPSQTSSMRSHVKQESNASTKTAFSETVPRSPKRKPSTDQPKPATPGHSLSRQKTIDASGLGNTNTTAQQPPKQICENCHLQFRSGTTDDCFYHPGRKVKAEDISGRRITKYSCCDGQVDDAPCQQGDHRAPAASALDKLKRQHPDESPFFRHKSPRLF